MSHAGFIRRDKEGWILSKKKEVKSARAGAQAANAGRRRRRRRGRRTLHFILLILFILAVFSVLSFTVFFKIEEVRVLGVDKYPPDEVAEASGIIIGENLLSINPAEIQQTLIDKYPYINNVEVRRKLPPAVELTISQEEPKAALREGDQVVLITSEGKVLERGMLIVPEGVPLVKGMSATGVPPGQYLAEEQKSKLVQLQYLLDAIEKSGFDQITNVDLSNKLDIRVMYQNRLLLRLGTEIQLEDKLTMVKFVLGDYESASSGVINAATAHKGKLVFSPGKETTSGTATDESNETELLADEKSENSENSADIEEDSNS